MDAKEDAATPAEPEKPVVPKEQKRKSVFTIFAERMRREGKFQEYQKRCKQVMAEQGKSFDHARKIVMPQMGYPGPVIERRNYERWVAEQGREQEKVAERKIFGHVREEKKISDFESSLRGLPAAAPPNVELDWVRAHPALCRLARMTEKKEVVITAEDVLDAPHGPAPSRAAVNMLQDAANRPAKFHDTVLNELKKRMEDKGAAAAAAATADLTLDEVKNYLTQVQT